MFCYWLVILSSNFLKQCQRYWIKNWQKCENLKLSHHLWTFDVELICHMFLKSFQFKGTHSNHWHILSYNLLNQELIWEFFIRLYQYLNRSPAKVMYFAPCTLTFAFLYLVLRWYNHSFAQNMIFFQTC